MIDRYMVYDRFDISVSAVLYFLYFRNTPDSLFNKVLW